MGRIGELAAKLPIVRFVYRALCGTGAGKAPKSEGMEEAFTQIYRHNVFGGKDSFSGTGSDLEQTRIIREQLPALLEAFQVSTVLDLPCGDFHWMKDVNLARVDYTGADIVEDLIRSNRMQHARNGIGFRRLDIVRDPLPRVDLVFCRDCLVHLSYEFIGLALANVCNSGSRYLLTTTFTGRTANHDIVTGQWRPINLQLAPFGFPEPVRIVNEGCTEDGGAFADKALGLWRVADIRGCLAPKRG